MKKITLLFIFCLTIGSWSYGQCTDPVYQFPPATVTIAAAPGPQTIVGNMWPQNEFSVIDGLIVGDSYTLNATPDPADPDLEPNAMTYVTATSDGTAIIADGFAPLSFVATTAEITVYWTLDAACANGPNRDTLTEIECTTCTCSAAAAPDAVTMPTPADGETGVILMGDGEDGVEFSWVEATTGEPADSYTISIGQNFGADDIGTLADVTSGGVITFGAAQGTTYFWKIDAVNCAGTTSSAIWSFTTEACTAVVTDAAITPTPADGAVDVPLVGDGGGVEFSWVEAATGGVADSFTISIGLTATGDDIGSLAGVDSGGVINFGGTEGTTYFWKIDAVNCAGATSSAIWSFTTGTCTETAVPPCSQEVAPLNNATAVPTVENDDGMGGITREVAFEWGAVPGATGYEFTLDGTLLGATPNTTVDIFGLDYDTTYTWSVAPVNCFGTATGCATWTFTTEPSLSVNEFEQSAFTYAYDSNLNRLKLESSNNAFNDVTIFSISGQKVISKLLNSSSESIDVSELSTGIYLAKVSLNGNSKTIKFIKN